MGQRYNGSAEWRQVVPVAFHVDYWDQLGWKDRFAKPEFTSRQRLYCASWQRGSVYTPCFVLNGEEWQGWGYGVFSPFVLAAIMGKLVTTIKHNNADVTLSVAKECKKDLVLLCPLSMAACT